MSGAGGGEGLYVEEVFGTYVYDGNGATNSIDNGIDLDGEGGMVWIKSRTTPSTGQYHHVVDSERAKIGGFRPAVYPNATDQENEYPAATNGGVSSLNSDGFTLSSGSGSNDFLNANTHDYVSWTFRKAPGFFDVVTWSGNDTNRTIEHGLACVPGSIWVKHLNGTGPWLCYHKSLGNTKNIELQSNNDEDTNAAMWNNTDPTSTHFTLGTNSNVNGTGRNFVAYLFADGDDADAQIFGNAGDESIIKCGGWSGSTTINLGWEPQWVLAKRYDGTGNWHLFDTMRGFLEIGTTNNGASQEVNSAQADAPSQYGLGPTSTGLVSDGGQLGNDDYIYIAIRRGPMKTPEDATKVFAIDYGNGSTTIPTWDSGFPVDAATKITYGSSAAKLISARLMGAGYLQMSGTSDQSNDSALSFDSNSGWGHTYTSAEISHMFRRAPGFFDVVCYEGTGSARTVPHNLGVEPELIIIKTRDSNEAWRIYAKPLGNTYSLLLPYDYAKEGPQNGWWAGTTPVESQFSLGTEDGVNKNTENYIAYLFASCPGVSKVGSYTGPGIGNDIDVDCGFTSGARFVLIKRTDADNDWFCFDTVRGISTGSDDPFFFLNTYAAQVTDSDRLDANTSGFTVRPNADAESGLNTNGGEYIYLAIA